MTEVAVPGAWVGAYLSGYATGPGPWPGVIVIHDAWASARTYGTSETSATRSCQVIARVRSGSATREDMARRLCRWAPPAKIVASCVARSGSSA